MTTNYWHFLYFFHQPFHIDRQLYLLIQKIRDNLYQLLLTSIMAAALCMTRIPISVTVKEKAAGCCSLWPRTPFERSHRTAAFIAKHFTLKQSSVVLKHSVSLHKLASFPQFCIIYLLYQVKKFLGNNSRVCSFNYLPFFFRAASFFLTDFRALYCSVNTPTYIYWILKYFSHRAAYPKCIFKFFCLRQSSQIPNTTRRRNTIPI